MFNIGFLDNVFNVSSCPKQDNTKRVTERYRKQFLIYGFLLAWIYQKRLCNNISKKVNTKCDILNEIIIS